MEGSGWGQTAQTSSAEMEHILVIRSRVAQICVSGAWLLGLRLKTLDAGAACYWRLAGRWSPLGRLRSGRWRAVKSARPFIQSSSAGARVGGWSLPRRPPHKRRSSASKLHPLIHKIQVLPLRGRRRRTTTSCRTLPQDPVRPRVPESQYAPIVRELPATWALQFGLGFYSLSGK